MIQIQTELLLSHAEGTELTNGKVKTENGRLVYRTQKAQKTQNFTDLF